MNANYGNNYDNDGRDPQSGDTKSSGGTGTKITFGFLLLLDLVVIGLMIYSTTAKFAMVGRWTVQLNEEFRIKGKNATSTMRSVNGPREKLLYAMYKGIVIFALATLLYSTMNIRAASKPDLEDDNGSYDRQQKKSGASPMLGYAFAFGYAFAWSLTLIGGIVIYLEESTYRLMGTYTFTVENGAQALAGAWVILLFSGTWRGIRHWLKRRKRKKMEEQQGDRDQRD